MTNTSKYFYIYVPCLSNKKIIIADDSINIIAGKADVKFRPTLILKNVLHVPKLCINLVSVNKLSQDLNCKIIFKSFYCDFDDWNSGKIIG